MKGAAIDDRSIFTAAKYELESVWFLLAFYIGDLSMIVRRVPAFLVIAVILGLTAATQANIIRLKRQRESGIGYRTGHVGRCIPIQRQRRQLERNEGR